MMFYSIISFFMSIVYWFLSLFGLGGATHSCTVLQNIAYGEHERQVFDLYIPKDASGDIGIVVSIHGGAWTSGSKDGYKNVSMIYADNCGVAALALNYRYLDENTDMNDILDDITACLTKAQQVGAENGVHFTKMMTTGASAGGHLSLLYAYSRADESPILPVCVLSNCGPTDLTSADYASCSAWGDMSLYYQLMSSAVGMEYSANPTPEAKAALLAVSPITYVKTGAVPTVICHGEKDDIVPYSNATLLRDALNELGVRCDFVTFPNSGHGLDKDTAAANQRDTLCGEYINTYLKG